MQIFFLFSYDGVFIGDPGRSIPGQPGIDGYAGQSGLPGGKGKVINQKENIFIAFFLIGERGLPGLRGLPGNSTAGVGLPGPQGRMYFLSTSI
jgi:hypothetical protein